MCVCMYVFIYIYIIFLLNNIKPLACRLQLHLSVCLSVFLSVSLSMYAYRSHHTSMWIRT